MSDMPIGLEENTTIDGARIKVIGVGGGGNNAVDRMIEAGVTKAEFICVNTDAQQLANVKAPTVLNIGRKLTSGLGAGAKPEIGRQAAEESKDEIKNLVKDTEMVICNSRYGRRNRYRCRTYYRRGCEISWCTYSCGSNKAFLL